MFHCIYQKVFASAGTELQPIVVHHVKKLFSNHYIYYISEKWRRTIVMSHFHFFSSLVAAWHSEGPDEHVDEKWHQKCWVGGMLKVRWDHLSMQWMIKSLLSFCKDCQSALEQISKPMPTFTPVILTLLHTLMKKHQLHPLLVCWDIE